MQREYKWKAQSVLLVNHSSSDIGCDHDIFVYLVSSDLSFVDVDKIW